jgi:hypothetical protein
MKQHIITVSLMVAAYTADAQVMQAKSATLSNGWAVKKGDTVTFTGSTFLHTKYVKKKNKEALLSGIKGVITQIIKPEQSRSTIPIKIYLDDSAGREIRSEIEFAMRSGEIAIPPPFDKVPLPSVDAAIPSITTEYDKFEKKWRVQSGNVNITPGFTSAVSFSLRSIGDSYFLTINGNGWATGVVGPSDQMIFLLDNDDRVTLFPTGIQSTDIHASSYGVQQTYSHQYRIDPDQMKAFEGRSVKSIRRYFSSNYEDMELKDKHMNKLPALISAFLTIALNIDK